MYTVKYFWRSDKGYKMVDYKDESLEMVEQLIREIKRSALKRDYVEVFKDDEIFRVVNF